MTNRLLLKVLTAEEESTIYEKCLDFLSNKGVRVQHPQALKILGKAGAQVDFDNQQVRFPKDIIETALHSVPHGLTLAGSDQRHDCILPHPSGLFYTRTSTGCRLYVEPGSNTYRDVTLADVAEYGQLIEVLDNVNFSCFLTPTDAPEETGDIHSMKTILENTSKHMFVQPWSFESVEYLIELALAVAGSTEALKKRPIMNISSCATTPFVHKAMDAEIIIQACRHGIPVRAASLPGIGGVSPITIAGTVLQTSIEVLAILVMTQLVQPGAPVISSTIVYMIDMVTGRNVSSNIQSILCSAALAQFIKNTFNIPTGVMGFGADSYIPDGEAGMQTGVKGLLVSLAGGDILFNTGRVNAGLAVSPVELILDNTLASVLKQALLGVKVDDDTLAWNEILNTMPGDHYLERAHTLQHCREALRTELFVSQPYETWQAEGSKDLHARAVDKYRELKKGLKPLELPKEVHKELDRIVKQADEHLVNK